MGLNFTHLAVLLDSRKERQTADKSEMSGWLMVGSTEKLREIHAIVTKEYLTAVEKARHKAALMVDTKEDEKAALSAGDWDIYWAGPWAFCVVALKVSTLERWKGCWLEEC